MNNIPNFFPRVGAGSSQLDSDDYTPFPVLITAVDGSSGSGAEEGSGSGSSGGVLDNVTLGYSWVELIPVTPGDYEVKPGGRSGSPDRHPLHPLNADHGPLKVGDVCWAAKWDADPLLGVAYAIIARAGAGDGDPYSSGSGPWVEVVTEVCPVTDADLLGPVIEAGTYSEIVSITVDERGRVTAIDGVFEPAESGSGSGSGSGVAVVTGIVVHKRRFQLPDTAPDVVDVGCVTADEDCGCSGSGSGSGDFDPGWYCVSAGDCSEESADLMTAVFYDEEPEGVLLCAGPFDTEQEAIDACGITTDRDPPSRTVECDGGECDGGTLLAETMYITFAGWPNLPEFDFRFLNATFPAAYRSVGAGQYAWEIETTVCGDNWTLWLQCTDGESFSFFGIGATGAATLSEAMTISSCTPFAASGSLDVTAAEVACFGETPAEFTVTFEIVDQ